MTPKHSLLISFSLVLVAACSDFPQLDDTISEADRAAAFPDLVNLDTLLSDVPTGSVQTASNDLDARLAALQSKAARLRGAVLTTPERNRLARGVAVPAAIR